MHENMPLDNSPPFVTWPHLPPHVEAAVELKCRKCGYKIRWTSPKSGGEPTNFSEMAGNFLSAHEHPGGVKH